MSYQIQHPLFPTLAEMNLDTSFDVSKNTLSVSKVPKRSLTEELGHVEAISTRSKFIPIDGDTLERNIYLNSLSDKELKAYAIANSFLKDTFQLEKCNGFLKWKKAKAVSSTE